MYTVVAIGSSITGIAINDTVAEDYDSYTIV